MTKTIEAGHTPEFASFAEGRRYSRTLVVALAAERDRLREALEALTEWGCTYTSPLDKNSPHDLLIKARAALKVTT